MCINNFKSQQLGCLGELPIKFYVAKIYKQSRNKNLYIVESNSHMLQNLCQQSTYILNFVKVMLIQNLFFFVGYALLSFGLFWLFEQSE